MSNPPVEPSSPDGPESGKQAPQYGQNTPQYGQQAPQYGQNAPQYGQQPPAYGQGQYGQSPYGQSPYAQYPSELPTGGAGTRPSQLDLAFWLIIGAGVLSLINSLVVSFSGPGYFETAMQQAAAQQGRKLTADDLNAMRAIIPISGVIGGLISFGLYSLVAFPVRKGKNWARILGTVFAAFSLLGLFGGMFAFGVLSGILQLVVILMGAAGIVILYLPSVAPYFQKQQPFANPYSQGPYGR